MPLFTSIQEKWLWLGAGVVCVAIYSTLLIGRPLAQMLRDQNIQAIFFVAGMLLVAVSILFQGLSRRPSRITISSWLGIMAVYVMFVFRLGAAERSHVIEYSVLAIFVYKALLERARQQQLLAPPFILAALLVTLTGILDEVLQLWLPGRVFDLQDIVFNTGAVFMALGAVLFLNWTRNRFDKPGSTA